MISQHDPGALNHRVALKQYAEISDGCGGVEIIWNHAVDCWAQIVPLKVRVNIQSQQTIETATHEITIRFRTDVASGWRIELGTRIFSIQSLIDPDERKRYLVCRVEEEGR